jgi:predicted transcriptional regulator
MFKKLKAARQEVDLLQKELADLLGVTGCYLSQVENLRKISPGIEKRAWEILRARRKEMQSMINKKEACDETTNIL